MTFRCPVTIDNVFSAPTPTQVKVFYESRSSRGKPFDHLPEGEKLAWTESLHDNKTLMGFIVYTQLFPKLLQNRIKLNAATYHWAHLDNSSEKGRTKLEQRRNAVDRLKRNGFTRSVFMGLPYRHGVESGAVVGVIDVIRDKPVEAIGKIDGGVLGSIFSTYGERACLKVQAECSRLEGGSSLFDDSVSTKLSEILAHFDCELWKARKKDKVERVVAANMDPAGMNKKIEGGKMLDPTDPKSIDLMHTMLQTISGQVWKPLKKLIGQALGASLEYPAAFLRITQEEGEQLYKHVLSAGVTYTDVANLCTLLLLSFSFQRSQVLREATVDEFVLVPDATHYKFSFKNRRFKTASSEGTSSASPVSHFMLSPDQSMITRFIAFVGHRFCGTLCLDNKARRLFVNTKGQSWTQKDISSRFKRIGMHWLGISNFGPHVCRTFWSTHALHSGQISGSNLEDFSSFLQVSSTTLRNKTER
ncbi:unnamed protein product [Ectocarpus sp. 4 AP-2014]